MLSLADIDGREAVRNRKAQRSVARPRTEAESDRDEAAIIDALVILGSASIKELSELLDLRPRLVAHTVWRGSVERGGLIERLGDGRYAVRAVEQLTLCSNREEPYCWVWPDGYDGS